MKNNYIDILNQSVYSPNGLLEINDILSLESVKETKTAVIVDNGNLLAAPIFEKAAKKKGVKPVFGITLSVKIASGQQGRLVLLAKNREGLNSLIKVLNNSDNRTKDTFFSEEVSINLLDSYDENGVLIKKGLLSRDSSVGSLLDSKNVKVFDGFSGSLLNEIYKEFGKEELKGCVNLLSNSKGLDYNILVDDIVSFNEDGSKTQYIDDISEVIREDNANVMVSIFREVLLEFGGDSGLDYAALEAKEIISKSREIRDFLGLELSNEITKRFYNRRIGATVGTQNKFSMRGISNGMVVGEVDKNNYFFKRAAGHFNSNGFNADYRETPKSLERVEEIFEGVLSEKNSVFKLDSGDFLEDIESYEISPEPAFLKFNENIEDIVYPKLEEYLSSREFFQLCEGKSESEIEVVKNEYRNRLKEEISVFRSNPFKDGTDFSSYLVSVYKIVEKARENDIFAVSRGSGGGSLCVFVMGVSTVDPVNYGLSFERFFTGQGGEYPDLDIDFSDRDGLVNLLKNDFFKGKEDNIAILSVLEGRSGISNLMEDMRNNYKLAKDNGKVGKGYEFIKHLDEVLEDMSRWADRRNFKFRIGNDKKAIMGIKEWSNIKVDDFENFLTDSTHDRYNETLNAILKVGDELREYAGKRASLKNDPVALNALNRDYMEVFNKYKKEYSIDLFNDKDMEMLQKYHQVLRGIVSYSRVDVLRAESFKKSPASFVLAPEGVSLKDIMPVQEVEYSKKDVKTVKYQVEAIKETVEDWGLMKFDLLPLKFMAKLGKACKDYDSKNPNNDTHITPNSVEVNLDSRVFKLFEKGFLESTFQAKSFATRASLEQSKPKNLLEIAAAIAVVRPSSKEYVDMYAKNKSILESGGSIPSTGSLIIDGILRETCGVLVYQEQIMEIFKKIGGLDTNGVFKGRKAIQKNDESKLNELKEDFFEGAKRNRISEIEASNSWDFLHSKLGNYGYNKSHAMQYAHLMYKQLFIRYNDPEVYIKNFINKDTDSSSSKLSINNYIYENVELGRNIKIAKFGEVVPNPNENELVFSHKVFFDDNDPIISVLDSELLNNGLKMNNILDFVQIITPKVVGHSIHSSYYNSSIGEATVAGVMDKVRKLVKIGYLDNLIGASNKNRLSARVEVLEKMGNIFDIALKGKNDVPLTIDLDRKLNKEEFSKIYEGLGELSSILKASEGGKVEKLSEYNKKYGNNNNKNNISSNYQKKNQPKKNRSYQKRN